MRQGVTTAEAQRAKELEREVNELRWANEILKLASVFMHRQSSTANSSTEGNHRPIAQAAIKKVANEYCVLLIRLRHPSFARSWDNGWDNGRFWSHKEERT